MPDPSYSRVGPTSVADGTNPALRSTQLGALVTQSVSGKYAEAVARGNVYAGATAATGVAPGTALGTTAAFALYNPAGSGKRFVVQTLSMGQISGTLGAGVVWITSDNSATAVPTGTAITPRNRLIGSGNASVATCLTTATITTNAAKMIGILCSLNEAVIATTAVNNEVITRDMDGEVQLQEGCLMTIHATAAAGTSPLVVFCATWEEVTKV